jgi:hypothetical protein
MHASQHHVPQKDEGASDAFIADRFSILKAFLSFSIFLPPIAVEVLRSADTRSCLARTIPMKGAG